MNLPNRLTMSRILFALGLFVMLEMIRRAAGGSSVLEPGKATLGYIGFVVFLVAVATDVLDGHLARKRGIVSDFGRIADPFADKILIAGSLVFLCATEGVSSVIQPWVVVVILAREFLVTGLRGFIEARGISFAAKATGKLKMVLQSVLVGGAIFSIGPGRSWEELQFILYAIMIATVVVTLWSGWTYVREALAILDRDERERTGSRPPG